MPEKPSTIDASSNSADVNAELIGWKSEGALIDSVMGKREVNYLPISESELVTLKNHNSEITFWTSALAAIVALALACIWDMMTNRGSSDFDWYLAWGFVAMLTIGGIASSVKRRLNARGRDELLDLIRREVDKRDV